MYEIQPSGKIVWLSMPKSQQPCVRSRHPPTQWNLRGGRWKYWITYIKRRKKQKSTKCFSLSSRTYKKGKAVHLRRKYYAEVWSGLPWQTSAGPPSRSSAQETPLGLFPIPAHKNTRRRIHVKDESPLSPTNRFSKKDLTVRSNRINDNAYHNRTKIILKLETESKHFIYISKAYATSSPPL